MILVAGGDSFVWGSELSDCPHGGPNGYSKKTFPALLASEYHCAAYPGIGNKEIYNRTIEHIKVYQPDIVLVCWTWSARDNDIDSDVYISGLETFLQNNNIKYLFTCADNCVITGNLDYTNWFFFPPGTGKNQTESPRGFYQWAVENKYPVGLDRHPLEEAHQQAAKLMKDKFNELAKKYIQ